MALTSCGSYRAQKNSSTGTAEKEYRLKVGPVWHKNESKLVFVYGVSSVDSDYNYITELHFNFGGQIDCLDKSMWVKFDFSKSPHLLLPDSVSDVNNRLIQRVRNSAVVEWKFRNPSPGILMFTIEKVNLKPDGHRNEVNLSLNSTCSNYVSLPIELVKIASKDVSQLEDLYIKNELDKLSVKDLQNMKVIFSFNGTMKMGEYLADLVDQQTMQILSFSAKTNEYIITDFENNEIKRVKRST